MSKSLDVDVDVDWLYKGKRKAKQARRERSNSVNNGSLGHVAANQAPLQDAAPKSPKPKPVASEAKSPPNAPKRSSSVSDKSKKSLFGTLFRRNSHGSGDRPSIPIPLPKSRSNSNASAHAPEKPTGSSNGTGAMNAAVSQYLNEPSSPEVKDPAPIHDDRLVLNRNPHRKSLPIESLAKTRLRRVTFAVDKFGMDPPQQIPSRKPKRGNVLVPQDLTCPTPSISVGITNTQGSIEQSASPLNEESKEYKLAVEEHRRALKESEKHQQEAHYAAQRIAHEVLKFKAKPQAGPSVLPNTSSPLTATESQPSSNAHTAIDDRAMHLEIDKPIHMHESHFNDETSGTNEEEDKLTLDKIYTRCCHLREILPIPSTLKQIKGKSSPLQTLKFLNPRPTLIDILSFCDFISIVPVHNVIFDNVSLNPEMLKNVISSLVSSKVVEKIGFRNVVFTAEGWKLLCKFLMRNTSLLRLDISQTKIKPDLDKSLYRAKMDWNLFIDVLQRREGRPLEELLINGVKFEDFDTFINLLTTFASEGSHTRKRLGIAQSDLSAEQLKFVMSWVSDYKVQGVDMAFNDLSDLVKPLVGKLSSLPFSQLNYFTLNNTNIMTAYDAALLLRALSKLPNLYFLDLSNLPQIFPEVFPYLNKYLPRMANLKRLHLDSNEFTSREVAMVTNVLPKCSELLHLSLLNIPQESFTTATCATVYDCVRQCSKLTNLDIAYNCIPEEISSRIAICFMRRMQRDFELDDLTNQDDLLFDGTLLSETAENVFEKLNNFEDLETDATRRYLLKKYWEKFNRVHDRVQSTIDEMFEKRSAGELNLQSKENLLRLLFLENNLSNILDVLKSYPQVADVAGIERNTRFANSENLLSGLSSEAENHSHVKPHLMATDSGRTIDVTTGTPILVKTPSHVALVGKKQEEEEGEFHKWGFFVQQQNSIYPDHHLRNAAYEPAEKRPSSAASSAESPKSSQPSAASQATTHALISKIPSGTELRDAVMRAKGINSIEELIGNVNRNRVTLDNIYGVPLHPMSPTLHDTAAKTTPISQVLRSSSSVSEASSEDEDEEKVDETYDKLLSSLSKVRSNK